MELPLLYADWLGQPLYLWLIFLTVVVVLLAVDLGILHRDNHEVGVRESLLTSACYIALGVLFGGFVWWQLGATAGMDYLTGFAVEKSLAMDNIFVIALIFSFFAIPRHLQYRVLFWGIIGVIVLRAVMIGFGTAIVSNFSWVLYIFALFLIATGIKMALASDHAPDLANNPVLRFMRRRFNVTDEVTDERFFVRRADPATGKSVLYLTPLFLALVLIEIADLIFAVDSIPAIFAITTDPFVVYTSNIFAILGLRALYFALAAMVERFRYLKYALAAILVFIGSKIFVADLLGIDKVPPAVSLGVTLGLLAAGIAYSLIRTRPSERAALPAR